MKYEKELYTLLDKFRGELNSAEILEIFFVGTLIYYLDQDEKYCKVIDMKSLLEEDDELSLKLQQILKKIEEEIPYFKDVFSHLTAIINVTPAQLTNLLYVIKEFDIESIGYDQWCEHLIRQFEDSGVNRGEHTSPDTINQLSVKILSPQKGTFYDGTFGFGGGAINALRYSEKRDGVLEVWGQELNMTTYALAKIRFFLIGKEDIVLEVGDIFAEPMFTKNDILKTFNYIYMDIPKSYKINYDFKNDPYNRFIYGKPNQQTYDLGFISHMLASLKKTGRAVIVVGDGTLFRGGAHTTIRKNIINSNVIESVISLPSGLYKNTGIPVNLVIFNKNKPNNIKDKILFINARDLYTEDKKSKRYISTENITKIVQTVESGSEVEEFSKYVKNVDLIDWSLLPSRYIIRRQLDIPGYGEVKFDLDLLNYLKTIPLKNKATFFNGYNVGSNNKENENGQFMIIRLSDVKDGKIVMENVTRYDILNNARVEQYLLRENDVILSTRGTSLKVAIIPPHHGEMLLSQNFIGIRCGDKLNPAFLKAYLESPIGKFILINKLSGTAIPTLRRKDIESIEIPDIPMTNQERMMHKYLSKEQLIEEKITILKQELEEAKGTVLDEMGVSCVYRIIEHKK